MKQASILATVILAAAFLTACGNDTSGGGQTAGPAPATSFAATTQEDTKKDLTDSASLPEDTKEAQPMVITKAIKFSKGTVKNSVQGMSVWQGKLFQLYHTGDCNVFDLDSDKSDPIATFRLGSASDGNHANNCNFSTVHYNGNPIPLLYVVDGNSGDVMKCSVENIVEKDGKYTSECIQTLHLDQSGFAAAEYMPYWGWPSWLVGTDGSNEVTYICLELFNELRLLQPQGNIQVSERTPDNVIRAAARVFRNGMGYPSVFSADMVIQEQMRVGKTLEDAREGGTSGCIETGCSGKEAYLLHGYLNVPKLLEYALSNGVDLLTGKQVSIKTGELSEFKTFDDLYAAFEKQMAYVVDTKIGVDNYLRYQYATNMAATYLSCVIRDCIQNGKDYYNGGPRYNSDYIQCCGIGTITDSLSAIKKHVYDEGTYTLQELVDAMKANWEGHEAMRLTLWNKTPFFGNDDDYADDIMRMVYDSLFRNIDGKHSILGPTYHLNMLSTTCHNYFGQKLAATPNGRFSGMPESDGTSPSHGADRHGPTAVVKSLGKMDQVKSGGTLLNQRFLPSVLAGEEGIEGVKNLIRAYFKLGGHHIQFNVVDEATLRDAQAHPDNYQQEEIIARNAQESF